jgi:hypothetical protein
MSPSTPNDPLVDSFQFFAVVLPQEKTFFLFCWRLWTFFASNHFPLSRPAKAAEIVCKSDFVITFFDRIVPFEFPSAAHCYWNCANTQKSSGSKPRRAGLHCALRLDGDFLCVDNWLRSSSHFNSVSQVFCDPLLPPISRPPDCTIQHISASTQSCDEQPRRANNSLIHSKWRARRDDFGFTLSPPHVCSSRSPSFRCERLFSTLSSRSKMFNGR